MKPSPNKVDWNLSYLLGEPSKSYSYKYVHRRMMGKPEEAFLTGWGLSTVHPIHVKNSPNIFNFGFCLDKSEQVPSVIFGFIL